MTFEAICHALTRFKNVQKVIQKVIVKAIEISMVSTIENCKTKHAEGVESSVSKKACVLV